MWHFIYLALIGLCAGAAAQYLMPGEDPGNLDDAKGIAITILIGLAGSFIGGLIGGIIGLNASGFIGEIILAVVGAIVFLWVYKKIREK